MNHKLRSEMSPQKIDTSPDIIFGSLTLLEGFVILDLNNNFQYQSTQFKFCIDIAKSFLQMPYENQT